MIKHSTDGLLFFEGRELRIFAYGVSRTHAQVHADGLGLLPINFYITFDGFLTVAKCRLVWRWRHDISVVFSRGTRMARQALKGRRPADLNPSSWRIYPQAHERACTEEQCFLATKLAIDPRQPLAVPGDPLRIGQAPRPISMMSPTTRLPSARITATYR